MLKYMIYRNNINSIAESHCFVAMLIKATYVENKFIYH